MNYRDFFTVSKMRRFQNWMFMLAFIGLTGFYGRSQTIQLGSGTGTTSYFPLYYNYDYNYSQTIYTAAEMQAQGASATGGTITKIRFKSTSTVATSNWIDWVVYLGNTPNVGFASVASFIPTSSMTEVFNGQIPANVTAGQWMEITLTTPFVWNGTDNIVVAIDENTSAYGGSTSWQGYTLAPSTGSKGIYFYQDGTDIDPLSPSASNQNVTNTVAQIQFDGTLMDACSGVPTGGTTVLTPTSGNPNSALTGTVTGSTMATGLTYQWQYSDDAGATWNDIVGQTSATLATNAMAVFGTRQYRRAIYCGLDVAYSTPATFTTQLTYCTPVYTMTSDYTSAFSTNGAVANVTYTYPGTYQQYTNKTTDTIKAVIGNSFNFSHTYVGGSNTIRIWVDWNGDGTFDNATEQVFLSSPLGGTATQTGTIAIPGTAAVGNYRMRIRSRFSTTTPGACSSESYGSAIDYTLSTIALPVPPAITEAASPSCTTGAILSTTGTPGTNEAWYWQTTATGTSTANDATNSWAVFTNGTYYVRTFNSLYSVWGNADSIMVSDIPVANDPTNLVAAANPACVSTQISVDAPSAGQTNYWQGTNSNGIDQTSDASTPYTVNTTGTYYVRAYDATSQCWSNSVSIAVTINTAIPNDPIANPSQYYICTTDLSAIISAETTIGGPGSLTTITTGGNGCTNGNMFNITALGSMITINSFDIIPNSTSAQTVNVYYKSGTYVGSETNAGAWTLVGNYPINGTGGVLYNLDIADFNIPAGATYGIYIDYDAQYTTVPAGTTYANSDISVAVGAGLCTAFGGFNSPRAFNGKINYTSSVPVSAVWYDAMTGGNQVGTGNPFETVGTTLLPTVTAGSYDFFVASENGGCESTNRAKVTVNVNTVYVDLLTIDASCNTGSDGSFVLNNVNCGAAPFSYSVDGGAFGAIPTDLSVGQHTVQVKDANGDTSAVYTIAINGAAGPSAASVVSYNNSQATINWTAGGSETSWNIEWGAPGFTPGTGTELGSATANTNSYTINGLLGNTEYDIYISADCGTGIAGDWTPTNVWTLCDIQAIPYFESFDTTSTTIDCWSNEYVSGTEDWTIGSGSDAIITSPYEGTNNAVFVTTSGDTTKLVSPMIDMTGQDSVALTFAYGQPVWFGDQNTTRIFAKSISGTWQLLDTKSNDQSSWNVDTLFIPHLGDTMLIAFEGISDYGHANVIDAVSVSPCTITPGVDGSMNVCRLSNTVDLNTVITPGETWGKWLFPSNQGVVSGSIFNVSTLASGSYTLYYVVETPCANDTTIATVVVYNPSNAGQDGTITACRNQPINLLSGLNGNVDMNGTWYDPTLVAMPNASLMTANFPGQYNYKYVTSNGVCPNDTSNVVVNVQSCDWLAIDENVFTDVSIYPNPSTGIVNIEVPIDNMNLEVTDINGRVIESIKNTIKAGVNTVSLKEVERGVYFFKITNGDASKVFRVVIQ